MARYDEPYPFDDESHHTERSWKHGPWQGMDSRFVWNGSPNHRDDSVCIECGYKWGQHDFSYRAHPSMPVEVHSICWNCWMLDNNPEYMQKVWAKIDANNGFAGKKKETKLDHI